MWSPSFFNLFVRHGSIVVLSNHAAIQDGFGIGSMRGSLSVLHCPARLWRVILEHL
ncbi:hypothetical protein SJ05684_c22160 [Sinorhizobium sojae CCBAU 05684]|uniref:Uncharacterized protein n=1 Tax=Sinorhizobium sojae CCBAU 05684 TaxID=716928 RepID=A0A249PD67_9HYPH|nr:hypothetical protein SJ05684_c22160 [Sinorhizobium sojae CCBAU 05684]